MMKIEFLAMNKIPKFACDVRDNLVIYGDDKGIYKQNLFLPSEMAEDIDNKSKDYKYLQVVHMAVDWVSKNLYLSIISNTEPYPIIAVHPYGGIGSPRPVGGVKKYSYLYMFPIYDWMIESIAVHPNRGYIFVGATEPSGVLSGIYRFNSDGTDMKFLFKRQNVTSVSIDFEEDRLYWICEEGTILESAKIDDSTTDSRK